MDIDYNISEFEKYLVTKYNSIHSIGMYMERGFLYLSELVIKSECRNCGDGSRIMGELCEFADNNRLNMDCIVSSDSGEDERLVKFYSRFGFMVVQKEGVEFMERKCKNVLI